MRMSSRSPRIASVAAAVASGAAFRAIVLAAGAATALVLALLAGTAAAQGGSADTVLTRSQRESLERQLEAPDSAKGEGLWEEYQKYRDRDREDLQATGERVKVGDSVEVLAGELVEGDVVSIGGDVDVMGVVDGDVVAVGGHVILHDGAVVEGDAVSVGGRVKEEGSAVVRGEKVSVNVPIPMWGLRNHDAGVPDLLKHFLGWKLGLVAVGLVLALLFNAIAGQRLDVVSRRIEAEPGQSFLIGLLGAFGTPIAMLVAFLLLAITVVGLLLFPVLLILLWLVMLGGFAAVSIAVGRRVARAAEDPGALTPASSSYRNLAVGYLALHAFLILGMLLSPVHWGPVAPIGVLLGVLGFFVVVFGTIMGYGAALLSRLGTQTPAGPAWGGTPPPAFGAPVPPAPPAPSGHAPPMMTPMPPPPPAPPAPGAPPAPLRPPGES